MRDGAGDGPIRDDDHGRAMAGPGRADAWAAGGVCGAGAAECVVRLNLGTLKVRLCTGYPGTSSDATCASSRSRSAAPTSRVFRSWPSIASVSGCVPPSTRRDVGPNVARLTFRVLGARLDRDRDGLLVFFVCIILFRVAAAVYFLTHLLVAAAPVVMLAGRVTVARMIHFLPRNWLLTLKSSLL